MKSLLHLLFAATLCFLADGSSRLHAEPATPAVTGTFTGNGKPGNLAFVSARKGERVFDKETIVLIFTEKDHAKAAKPENKAAFGDFGSALVITVDSEGKIVGCEVAHAAHDKRAFSSVGTIQLTEFKNAGGELHGKLSSGGEQEFFKKTWDVNLTFHTKAP